MSVREYVTADGKSPFRQWLDSLTTAVRARIQARVLRFELGNLGDHKSVGKGVSEARVMCGPGYRIYFGKDGDSIIILLVGGDKGSQAKDVSRAHGLWRDYLKGQRWHGTAK
ncbi:MAG: type II toxin-antitoxin system RelE/ParE family toxin [Vicinamibacterales bacterium]